MIVAANGPLFVITRVPASPATCAKATDGSIMAAVIAETAAVIGWRETGLKERIVFGTGTGWTRSVFPRARDRKTGLPRNPGGGLARGNLTGFHTSFTAVRAAHDVSLTGAMPDTQAPSRLRRLAEQGVVPIALVLLPVLVAVLVFNARAAERSHRATAEDALRDYASFAAWQFSRQARQLLSSHLTMSTAPVRDIAASLGDSLPPAEVIIDHAVRCGCGFQQQIRFAFRIDLADGDAPGDGSAVETTVPFGADVRAALYARLTPKGLRPLDRDARYDPNGNKLRDASRLRIDTLGGTPYLLAYAVIGDDAGRPRAIYGLAADPAHLDHDFDRDIIRKQPLLPPSLVGAAENDSVLTVRTTSPEGVLAFESGRPVGSRTFSASDTLEPTLGSLVTTVSIRPDIASSLVIGGLPQSRLPL